MILTHWHKPQIASWSPLWQVGTLQDEIDRVFDAPLAGSNRCFAPSSGVWLPAVDVYEDKDNLYVKAELPGMQKDQIQVCLHEGVLTLSGERKTEEKHKEAEVYRSEHLVGRFQRSFTLPTAVQGDKVSATYKDGMLTVTLPKAEEAKPKQIEVKVN